jgi:hypothetical protein
MSDALPKPSTISPWLRGIIDTLVGARLISQSAIPHRNRLAVILFDSAFETSCRAYLTHKAKIKLSDSQVLSLSVWKFVFSVSMPEKFLL